MLYLVEWTKRGATMRQWFDIRDEANAFAAAKMKAGFDGVSIVFFSTPQTKSRWMELLRRPEPETVADPALIAANEIYDYLARPGFSPDDRKVVIEAVEKLKRHQKTRMVDFSADLAKLFADERTSTGAKTPHVAPMFEELPK